jgi:hypothetical protein
MDDGGFIASGGAVKGTNVVIYYFARKGGLLGAIFGGLFNINANGGVDGTLISSKATVTLSAPSTGAYKGVLFFQDRENDFEIQFQGSAATAFTGAIYAPKGKVVLTGAGAGVLGSFYISNALETAGGAVNVGWNGKEPLSCP